jgi:hypothetical protein
VPNMINIGPRPHPLNRGLTWTAGTGAPFIATPVDVSTLDRHNLAGGGYYLRVPSDRLLDVIVVAAALPETPEWQLCPQLSHPSINRGFSAPSPSFTTLSNQRRPLLSAADGRVILQHTRTSSSDLELAERTPGRLQQ